MTSFTDARASALGITGPLTSDQRIALDANAQLEKLTLAVGKVATQFSLLTNPPLRDEWWKAHTEVLLLTARAYREAMTKAGTNVADIPLAPL